MVVVPVVVVIVIGIEGWMYILDIILIKIKR